MTTALDQVGGPVSRPSSTDDELAQLRKQASKYERQNRRLRMLLDSFIAGQNDTQNSNILQSSASTSAPEPTPTPAQSYTDAGTDMGEEPDDETWMAKSMRLSKQYDLMSRQANYYKKSFEERDQKYKAQKKLLREWRQWYESYSKQSSHPDQTKQDWDSLDSRTRSALQRSSSPASNSRTPRLTPLPAQDEKMDETMPSIHKHSQENSRGNLQLQSPVSDAREKGEGMPAPGWAQRSPFKSRSGKNLSSQETEDENARPTGLDMKPKALQGSEDESGEIQFVSERQVRHAKRYSSAKSTEPRLSEENNVVNAARGLKFESPSPTSIRELPAMTDQGSVDLEEISGQVETPSRRQRLQSARRPQDVMNEPSFSSSKRPTTSRHLHGMYHGLANAGGTSVARKEDKKDHRMDLDHAVKHQKRTPLQPISANEHSDLRPKTLPGSKKRKKAEQLAEAIESLAEGGEAMSAVTRPISAQPQAIKSESFSKRQKLEDMLSPPVPAISRANGADARHLNQETSEIMSSTRRKQTPILTAKKRPLRETPLSKLGLDDFRINPNGPSSDGLGFAFSETVRGREARRCLPGCSDPRCCGSKFSKMVEIGGVNPRPRGSFWDDHSDDATRLGQNQGSEERRLLEQYLGRDAGAQQRIAAMTSAERRRAIIDAKATLLSEQYGKHRQAFQRRTTPPGFWRTDMPSTQEQAHDREQQDAAVREKVRERWEEAMRSGRGSRWIFRDEIQGRRAA